jgi:myb proto-oncogene protein
MEEALSNSSINDESLDKLRHVERTRWTQEQDLFIQDTVETYGTSDWNVVADNINKKFPNTHRSARQCRLRWQKHIHPLLIKHPWSEKEKVELLLAHHKFKNRWSDISSALNGRNNNSVKNCFYTIFRKVKNKIKKADYTYTSTSDLLQIHYILSVMKSYLSSLTGMKSIELKGGKDFSYKLLQHISIDMLTSYTAAFQEKTTSCGTMQELFEQMLSEAEPAKIVMPEEPLEETKKVENVEVVSPEQLVPVEAESPAKLMIFITKDPSPFENMILGPPSATMQKYSPCILSAGPAAAAAAAIKAPCFQAEPDDLGFSEFTERSWQTTSPNETKDTITTTFPKALSNMG